MDETTQQTTTEVTATDTSQAEANTGTTTGESLLSQATEGKNESLLTSDEATESVMETQESVPEKYEFTAPDGTELNQGLLDKFSEFAKENKFTQEIAQKLVDFQLEMEKEQVIAMQDNIRALRNDWIKQVKEDKEYGGANFAQSQADAKRGMKHLASPELMQVLKDTNMDCNPELFKMFVKAGRIFKEDKLYQGNLVGEKSVAKALYPNSSLND